MNEMIKRILSRVLTEEIEKQKEWAKDEDNITDRDYIIKEIEKFMEENGIEKMYW